MSDFFKNIRLDFIDWRLLTKGGVNRSDVTQRFEISTPQASLDFQAFMQLYPSAMIYDQTMKRYVPKRHPYRARRGTDARQFLWAIEALAKVNHAMGWR